MPQIFRNWLRPLAAVNVRISVGVGGLALVMVGQSAMAFLGPLD